MSRAAVVIDVTPDVSEIRSLAGSSFSLIQTLDADGGFTSASHDVSGDILAYRGVTPTVTTMTGLWTSANVAVVSLTGTQTADLEGVFGFTVYLTNKSDAADRFCIMRGHLTFDPPV